MLESTMHQVNGLLVAMEMERRGRALYIRAQQFTTDPKLLALLEQLASEEEVHYAQFSAMLDVYGMSFSDEEEHALAVAKAADFFFPGGLMQVAMDGALQSPASMLEEAIRAEEGSIAFYQRLLDYIDTPEQEKVVASIIEEENSHLKTLTERKNQY